MKIAFFALCMLVTRAPGGGEESARVEPGVFLNAPSIGHGALLQADRIVVTDLFNGVIVAEGKDLTEIREKILKCTKPKFSTKKIMLGDGEVFQISIQLYAKSKNGFVLICQFPLTEESVLSKKMGDEFKEWLKQRPNSSWNDRWGKESLPRGKPAPAPAP